MESTNLNHHLQDQLLANFSSPLPTYGVSSTLLNPSGSNFSGVIINPRQLQSDFFAPPSPSSPMVQEGLGFQWPGGIIRGELSESHHLKFNEMMPNSTSSLHSQATISYLKADHQQIREFFSGGPNSLSSLGNFSQILPTINISSLNQSSSSVVSSSPFEMNMQALDLLASGRFSGSSGRYQGNNALCQGLDLTQQPVHSPSSSLDKISAFNGVVETKRPGTSFLEPKVTQASQKKPRSDSRSTCPRFKVRKEKLGDRIAALQQLVAPFGKTDTASVLMEAIGYIKFLQNQVETLSVPYMRSCRSNKSSRGGFAANESDDLRGDLRSRGLCLVPLSCVADGGGGLWLPPNFTSS